VVDALYFTILFQNKKLKQVLIKCFKGRIDIKSYKYCKYKRKNTQTKLSIINLFLSTLNFCKIKILTYEIKCTFKVIKNQI